MEEPARDEKKTEDGGSGCESAPGVLQNSRTEISMKQFLDFLRTAYQVTDSVEDVLQAEGMVEEVDWIKLKNTEMIKPKAVSCQTSQTIIGDGDGIKTKLDEVLNEGLLDSVLPYMVPANQKKSLSKLSGTYWFCSCALKLKSKLHSHYRCS